MAVRPPLVYDDDRKVQELQLGDTLPGAAGLPPATEVGQILMSIDGTSFTVELPVTSVISGWLVTDEGFLIVQGGG